VFEIQVKHKLHSLALYSNSIACFPQFTFPTFRNIIASKIYNNIQKISWNACIAYIQSVSFYLRFFVTHADHLIYKERIQSLIV